MLWRFVSNPIAINDYCYIKGKQIIIARISAHSYGVLIGGNYLEITGSSFEQTNVRLFTWIACVICKANNLPLAQALYLHNLYSKWMARSFNYQETIKWLQSMLDWQPDTICFTYPLFLFDGKEYWQLIYDQLSPGQYVSHRETQAIIVCETWKKYSIFYRGQIEEYAVEKDIETGNYYLIDGTTHLVSGEDITEPLYITNEEGIEVLNLEHPGFQEHIELEEDQKISDYLKEIVLGRIEQITIQKRLKSGKTI